MLAECRNCTKWRVSCNGVVCDPERKWDGRNGGCSFHSDRQEDRMLGRTHRTPAQVLVRQTSLEAWL